MGLPQHYTPIGAKPTDAYFNPSCLQGCVTLVNLSHLYQFLVLSRFLASGQVASLLSIRPFNELATSLERDPALPHYSWNRLEQTLITLNSGGGDNKRWMDNKAWLPIIPSSPVPSLVFVWGVLIQQTDCLIHCGAWTFNQSGIRRRELIKTPLDGAKCSIAPRGAATSSRCFVALW